jgi:hypothetical protein
MRDLPNLGSESATQIRKRRWVPIAWLLGGFLVAYAYTFISATASDSENLSGCQGVVSALTSRHRLPPSVSEPGSPAVSCDLGVHFPLLRTYYSVFIYGVLYKGEQDAIADLRSFQGAIHAPKILHFFICTRNSTKNSHGPRSTWIS